MVADNQSVSQQNVKDPSGSSYKDTTVSTVNLVQVEADENTKIVAQNINDVKTVARNYVSIIDKTTTFNTNYEALKKQDYDGKSGLDVLNEGAKLKQDGSIEKVAKVSSAIDSVTKLADYTDKIDSVLGIRTAIEELLPLVEQIKTNHAIKDQIVSVAAIDNQIVEVLNYETQLILIYQELNKLITIFNYLPKILSTAVWVDKYTELQKNNNFTDQEYLDKIQIIIDNMASIFEVAANIPDINELKDIIKNAPTLLKDLREEFDLLIDIYTTKMEDAAAKALKDVKSIVSDITLDLNTLKGEVAGEVAKLKGYELNIKEIQLEYKALENDLKGNFATLDGSIRRKFDNFENKYSKVVEDLVNSTEVGLLNLKKEYVDDYSNLKRDYNKAIKDFETMRLEYESFKQNVDNYAKAKILDLFKVVLEPIFKENDLKIDGLDKLLQQEEQQAQLDKVYVDKSNDLNIENIDKLKNI